MRPIQKGIVCEKNKGKVVFLTANGEFLQGVPLRKDPLLGEEVAFYPQPPRALAVKKKTHSLFGAVALAAMLFLSIVMTSFWAEDPVFAYVQVDGDHSIELGINENGDVLEVRSLHPESTEASTTHYAEWKGMSLEKVIHQAAQQVQRQDEQLMITTVSKSGIPPKVQQQMDKALRQIQRERTQLPVKMQTSSMAERMTANQKGLSVQQYKRQQHSPPRDEKKSDNKESEIDIEEKRESLPANIEKDTPTSIPAPIRKESNPKIEHPSNSRAEPGKKNDASSEAHTERNVQQPKNAKDKEKPAKNTAPQHKKQHPPTNQGHGKNEGK